jgi:hypothetical protein
MFEYFMFHPDHPILSISAKILGVIIVLYMEYGGWKMIMSGIDDPYLCECKDDEEFVKLIANSLTLLTGIPILIGMIWFLG